MNAAEVNELIVNKQLNDRIKFVKELYPGMRLTLVVVGLKSFCQTTKKGAHRFAIEAALTEIQLMENVGNRLLDTAEDLGQTVSQFSKSVAEILYK